MGMLHMMLWREIDEFTLMKAVLRIELLIRS